MILRPTSALFLFCVAVVFAANFFDKSLMGPYEIAFKYMETCQSEPDYEIDVDGKLRKISKTKFSVTLNGTLPFPLDKKVGAVLSIAVFGNGGWKPNFYNVRITDVCGGVKNGNAKMFKQLTEQIGVPNECPIPKGKLILDEYIMNMDDIQNPVNILPYAQFRLDFNFTRKKHSIKCFRLYADTKPKS